MATRVEIKSYSRPGCPANFAVRYCFFSSEEGGGSATHRQLLRWDCLCHGEDAQRDGIFMIWPEFLDLVGKPFPDGPVRHEGIAHMFILDPDMREEIHRFTSLWAPEFFVEGAIRLAESEVTERIGRSELNRD